jgi:phosphatidylglycerophosphatase A
VFFLENPGEGLPLFCPEEKWRASGKELTNASTPFNSDLLGKEKASAGHSPFGKRLILALATWGGVGFLPGAPGTWGTAAALPLWWLLTQLGFTGYALALAALLAVGVLVAGPAQDLLGQKDHPAIVIDEVVGLLIALAGVPLNWTWALMGFLAFRALDILKPWPISRLNRGTSGLAVVADDVAAGVVARLVLAVAQTMVGGGG